LIESDAIDIEAELTGLTELMSVLGQIARSYTLKYFDQSSPSFAVGLFLFLAGLINSSFDKEDFPSVGIHINLSSTSQTQSGNLATDNIPGLGGAYRIGYKWKLLK
jgi:hypothetical protein